VGGLAPAANPTGSLSSGQIPAPATSRIADDMLAAEAFIDSTANASPAMGSANTIQNRKSVAAAGRVCFDERGSEVGI